VTDHAVKAIVEIVADKGYYSRTTVHDLETLEIRTYISEPHRGPQSWIDQEAESDAAGNACPADAANCLSDRVRISTRRVRSDARTCADTRMC